MTPEKITHPRTFQATCLNCEEMVNFAPLGGDRVELVATYACPNECGQRIELHLDA